MSYWRSTSAVILSFIGKLLPLVLVQPNFMQALLLRYVSRPPGPRLAESRTVGLPGLAVKVPRLVQHATVASGVGYPDRASSKQS